MHLVYPKQDSRIYVPVELDGNPGKTIFEAGHRNTESIIYWHLDEYYLGETRGIHQLEIHPATGNHRLTLIDQNGVSISVSFQVIGSPD
jgi:penicillin-binding protein 1C